VSKLLFAALGSAIAFVLAVTACGSESESPPLSGSIRIDGSPTIAPLTKAIARRFVNEHPDVRIAVNTSGTDAGFAKLCRGETDANGAAARIDGRKATACRRNGVAWGEIPVANDAVVLILAPEIPVRCLTTRQLNQIWHRDSEVTDHWSQVDDLDPPFGGPLTAWGPGTDTEEFAFFNESINGRRDSYRDYNNVLHRLHLVIPGILSTPGNFGYTEYGLYRRHADEVKAVQVDSGDGCVTPTPEAIAANAYKPLSRRLFLYPSAAAATRPAMEAFLHYYLDHNEEVAPRAGFVPLTDEQLEDSTERLERFVAGG
jgi:phosphate transport system substrate-binding protein